MEMKLVIMLLVKKRNVYTTEEYMNKFTGHQLSTSDVPYKMKLIDSNVPGKFKMRETTLLLYAA